MRTLFVAANAKNGGKSCCGGFPDFNKRILEPDASCQKKMMMVAVDTQN
jgi:hypothetical protein